MPNPHARVPRPVTFIAILLLVPAWLIAGAPQRAQPIPSPEQFFGFRMGAEKHLAGWDRIVDYFHTVDRGSDRVLVQEAGRTTMGRPYLLAVVSSPDTIANLAKSQEVQKRLADPRRTSPEEADRLAREGKVVLLVGANLHSTEIGSSQMVNDLLYKLATEQSPLVDHVLKNVILLIVPSQNPDGQQMVVDWYTQNVGTPYEDSPLPELYQKYAGHDNNRDSYMLTQVESQILARLMYKEWLPEIYLDEHQMGSNLARIFVPPFANPPNPNVDPLVWSEVNMLGQAMAAKLHEAGKAGVVWGELYSGFWQGANSTNPWWHNMIALMTETASSALGTTIEQEMAVLPDRQGPRGTSTSGFSPGLRMPEAVLPAPSDVQSRMNYTVPWLGGSWSPADVIDYQLLSTLGLLESAANNREMLKRNFYLMNRRTIELYRGGRPYAYLVPPDQHDPVAAAKLMSLLQAGGAEVHRADAPFSADGRDYPAGTHVLLLAQPFGRWIKDMLEPQAYPDVRSSSPSAPIDYPYDMTAWSLGMLMGVSTTLIEKPFEANLSLLKADAEATPGTVTGEGPIYIVGHESNNSILAMNRLLRAGAGVAWAKDDLPIDGQTHPPGTILVTGVKPATMAAMAHDLKLPMVATHEEPHVQMLPIRAPRVGLFEPWGGDTDAGWTRWIFEQYELPYTRLRNEDVHRPDLREQFDVIVLPEMPVAQILRGRQGRTVRPEHRGGIGVGGVRRLKDFVERGGTIVTLGNAAEFAIEQLGAPLEDVVGGLDPSVFFCPGSILRIEVNSRHPIGYGMPDQADAVFVHNGAYAAPAGRTAITTVARYPRGRVFRSGAILGESRLQGAGAVMEVPMGAGRIIIHGFRVQHRAQTWGTFKLLFNSIFYGAALAGPTATAGVPDAGLTLNSR